jgi:hypothetical protein
MDSGCVVGRLAIAAPADALDRGKTTARSARDEIRLTEEELPNDDTHQGGALALSATIQFSPFSIGAKLQLCWTIYRRVTGPQFRQASRSLSAEMPSSYCVSYKTTGSTRFCISRPKS